MAEAEIPPEQWQSFCNQFSQQHHGWLVTLSVVETKRLETDLGAAESAARPLARDATFQGITAELRDKNIELVLFVGEGPQRISHSVQQPLRICFAQTRQGAHQGLRIDAADGETTLVRFRTAALLETLDGIADF